MFRFHPLTYLAVVSLLALFFGFIAPIMTAEANGDGGKPYIPAYVEGQKVYTNFACTSEDALRGLLAVLSSEAQFRELIDTLFRERKCVFSPVPRGGVLERFVAARVGWAGSRGEAWALVGGFYVLLDERVGRQRGADS